MKKCAVIIAAYNADKYIMDCVRSVQKQIPTDGYHYEIRIGVDGCRLTSTILKHYGIDHYYSEKNVGAYVMRNSLIAMEPAEKYSIFDADDVMFPGYLIKTLKVPYCLIMTAKINCDENLKPITSARIEYGGAMTFDSNVLRDLGGFYNARCAADSDFMDRAKMAGYEIKNIPEGLYYRRKHSQSLTCKPDTGMRSIYRKKVWSEMTYKRNVGIIKIVPETVELKKYSPCYGGVGENVL